jgi:hypothetical protein
MGTDKKGEEEGKDGRPTAAPFLPFFLSWLSVLSVLIRAIRGWILAFAPWRLGVRISLQIEDHTR